MYDLLCNGALASVPIRRRRFISARAIAAQLRRRRFPASRLVRRWVRRLLLFDPVELAGAANTALPLEGLSRWSYNVAAMYEAHRISARLAWNWRERYLLTTSASNLNAPVWSENYGQLDGEAFYTLNGHIKVGLQGTNLLKARTYLDIGSAALAPRYSWTDTDRRFALAVRAQF